MRVWWDKIHVCRTPNDSGSYEEWRSRLDAGIPSRILYWKRAHSPPDNLSLPITDPFSCWNHTVGNKGYLNEIPNDIPYIFQHFYSKEMAMYPKVSIIFMTLIMFIPLVVFANEDEMYEMKKLFEPSDQQLIAEANGSIIIYDGIPDSEVDRAMDEHFNRIDNMMFTRIKYNNVNDIDSEVNEILTIDDDDC